MATVLIDKLLEACVKQGASDIHITVGQPPVFRLHGRLRKLETKTLDPDDTVALMKSISPERCQRELQEVGSADFGFAYGDKARFRVSIFKQRGNIAMVLRQIPTEMMTPEFLGVPEVFTRLCMRPRGLILVTGPTGSGKTTTLYSALSELNTIEDKLITTEDPVEYDIDGIIQIPIDHDIDVTFAKCLRAILRQDPDKILVGEIRDIETAEIAVQASLTGHTVFSTLHTNDAPSTITRLKDMGVPTFLITATVEAILAQRLVRRICPECREEVEPAEDLLTDLGLTEDDIAGKQFYRGAGCNSCNTTGYKGRVGLFELMIIDDELRDMIMNNETTDRMRDVAKSKGMVILRDAGINFIFDGTTTIEEVVRETILEA